MSVALESRAVAISFRALHKSFADKVALEDLSLEIDPGTFLVLLGPSGSGKTTLLRCLAGIERPTSGSIVIDGREVVGPHTFVHPEKRGLSMVFQDYALWPHLSVRKNVAFPLAHASRTKADKSARVDDLLERVGIAHLAERFPNQLSGGEQQRVALARALAADVGLVLFDEPLSNLDADRREQLRIEIATLTREAGVTTVYITHDQSEAFALADQVGVLNQGRLVQIGTPEALYRRPVNAFVARFTGVAGEFPVDVTNACGDHRYEVELPFARGELIEATSFEVLDPQGPKSLFVRASGVSLSNSYERAGVKGHILDVAFNGRGYEHVVRVGSDAVLSKVFSATRFERSSEVHVCFDASACFIMDPTKG